MRRFALLAGLVLASPLCLRAEDGVIYPRAAAPSGLTTEKPSTGASPFLVVTALVAAGAGAWLLWRQKRSPAGFSGGQTRKLAVSESRSLGNRQFLVVADYDGKKFLLGVCPGRIDMLSPLGDETKRIP